MSCPPCKCECNCAPTTEASLFTKRNVQAAVLGGVGLSVLFVVKQVAAHFIKRRWVDPLVDAEIAEDQAENAALADSMWE